VLTKIIFRLILISLGIALLLAGLFFDTGTAIGFRPQVVATPTINRLAEPTLPSAPLQADHGAQVFWLSCMPCHGDRGQGLTDEFRATYPTEDRNCWTSGCHGSRPYANGFKLPTSIPAVIGAGTLQKFANASVLEGYIKGAMPFWKPGSLTDDQAWQVTAFVLRANGLWDARVELNASNADQVRVSAKEASPTSKPESAKGQASIQVAWPLVIAGIIFLAVILLLILRPAKPRQM
jgi:mono/diheme cytochrome c family protein